MMVYCPKCGKDNKKDSKFCENCGENLANIDDLKVNKDNKNIFDKLKNWWNDRTKNEKILSGIGLCCLGILIFGFIGSFSAPDQTNLVNLELDNANITFFNGYETEIGENATSYDLSGVSEAGAIVTISSERLNLKDYKIKINSSGKFSLPLNISKDTNTVDINITAQKKGKDDANIDLTINRASKTVEPENTLTNDTINSNISGEIDGIKKIKVNNGNVTIDYSQDFWDEDSLIEDTSIDAIKVMKILFKDNRINSVTLNRYASFEDAYGNSKEAIAFNITITKETAKKINWDGIQDKVMLKKASLINIADDYYIAPGIYKELTFTDQIY